MPEDSRALGKRAYEYVASGQGVFSDIAKETGRPTRYVYSRALSHAKREGLPWPLGRPKHLRERSHTFEEEGLDLGCRIYWLRWLTRMPWPELDWEFGLGKKMASVYARTWALKTEHDWPITPDTEGPCTE